MSSRLTFDPGSDFKTRDLTFRSDFDRMLAGCIFGSNLFVWMGEFEQIFGWRVVMLEITPEMLDLLKISAAFVIVVNSIDHEWRSGKIFCCLIMGPVVLSLTGWFAVLANAVMAARLPPTVEADALWEMVILSLCMIGCPLSVIYQMHLAEKK